MWFCTGQYKSTANRTGAVSTMQIRRNITIFFTPNSNLRHEDVDIVWKYVEITAKSYVVQFLSAKVNNRLF